MTSPAVTIGPPSVGVPTSSATPARSFSVPSERRQTIFPESRSTAASTPQGGGVHGRSSGDSTTARRSDQGTPRIGSTSWPGFCSRTRSYSLSGNSVTECAMLDMLTTSRLRRGS